MCGFYYAIIASNGRSCDYSIMYMDTIYNGILFIHTSTMLNIKLIY